MGSGEGRGDIWQGIWGERRRVSGIREQLLIADGFLKHSSCGVELCQVIKATGSTLCWPNERGFTVKRNINIVHPVYSTLISPYAIEESIDCSCFRFISINTHLNELHLQNSLE